MAMPSSVIRWYKYDPKQKELIIAFVSGVKYVYKDVPAKIYKGFMAAGSKGKFLNTVIKPGYPFEKVNEKTNNQE